MKNQIIGLDHDKIKNFQETVDVDSIVIEYDCEADAVYGLGERYCSVNHMGRKLKSEVMEKFCEQGENAYFPLPFYHADDCHGVFVDTAYTVGFDFRKGHFRIEIPKDAEYRIYFIYGKPKEIIAEFVRKTGETVLPPKWAFGVWASANRWNCQKDIEEQMDYAKKYEYPINVVVIEAWSDEATFYMWNGAEYEPVDGGSFVERKNIRFAHPWPAPEQMIDMLHEKGMKLVLWQIPALKELEAGQICKQHDLDCAYAVEMGLVGMNMDKTPYKIPKQWFIGSMLPDFSNPETVKWWFAKRKYLLDMGVDGFKTDGGEFVHNTETVFYKGVSGRKVKNLYPALYEKAYTEFAGRDRILFSRAGYLGVQAAPMHWAGDQKSTFSELRSVLKAGLSLSLSGIPFWSFDIGGFAGPMPTKELYLRATALAAFVPAMQWHSEAAGGQFADIMKGTLAVNDRSPWNMSVYYGNDMELLEDAVFFANLHMNFLPYFYSEAVKCAENRMPFMKPLYLEYPDDKKVSNIEDEYMIGDLLAAPVTEEGALGRKVYLPAGIWYNFWDGSKIEGEEEIDTVVPYDKIPLYVREGAVIVLNLGESEKVGATVGNDVEWDKRLHLLVFGDGAGEEIKDENGIVFRIHDGVVKEAKKEYCLLKTEEYCRKIF